MSLEETQILKETNGDCVTETLILDENNLIESNHKSVNNDVSPLKSIENVCIF